VFFLSLWFLCVFWGVWVVFAGFGGFVNFSVFWGVWVVFAVFSVF